MGGTIGLGLGRLYDLIPGFEPFDMQVAKNADFVSLRNASAVEIVLFKGAGTAGQDPVLTFQQASVVAGTDAKNLAVITEHWQKQAATDLTGTGAWTRVTQTASQTVTLNATSAEEVGLYLFHIEADQLDVDNAFDCVRLQVADVGGAAQYGAVLYILTGLREFRTPASLVSAIVD